MNTWRSVRQWVALLGALLVAACDAPVPGSERLAGPSLEEVGVASSPLVATASYDALLKAPLCASAASGVTRGRSSMDVLSSAPSPMLPTLCRTPARTAPAASITPTSRWIE